MKVDRNSSEKTVTDPEFDWLNPSDSVEEDSGSASVRDLTCSLFSIFV
jgi:hypothetical protein